MNAYATHHYYFLTFTLNYKRKKKNHPQETRPNTRDKRQKVLFFLFPLKDLQCLTLGRGTLVFIIIMLSSFCGVF